MPHGLINTVLNAVRDPVHAVRVVIHLAHKHHTAGPHRGTDCIHLFPVEIPHDQRSVDLSVKRIQEGIRDKCEPDILLIARFLDGTPDREIERVINLVHEMCVLMNDRNVPASF